MDSFRGREAWGEGLIQSSKMWTSDIERFNRLRAFPHVAKSEKSARLFKLGNDPTCSCNLKWTDGGNELTDVSESEQEIWWNLLSVHFISLQAIRSMENSLSQIRELLGRQRELAERIQAFELRVQRWAVQCFENFYFSRIFAEYVPYFVYFKCALTCQSIDMSAILYAKTHSHLYACLCL